MHFHIAIFLIRYRELTLWRQSLDVYGPLFKISNEETEFRNTSELLENLVSLVLVAQ